MSPITLWKKKKKTLYLHSKHKTTTSPFLREKDQTYEQWLYCWVFFFLLNLIIIMLTHASPTLFFCCPSNTFILFSIWTNTINYVQCNGRFILGCLPSNLSNLLNTCYFPKKKKQQKSECNNKSYIDFNLLLSIPNNVMEIKLE